MNKKNKILSGVFWTAGGNIGSMLVRVGSMMILARLIMPAEFGLFSAVMVVFSISEIISNHAIYDIIVKYQEKNQSWINTAFSLAVIFNGIVFVLNILLAPWISMFFNMPELTLLLRFTAFVSLIKGLNVVQRALMANELDFKFISKVDVFSQFTGQTLISIILALMGMGVWSLLVGLLVYDALALVIYYMKQRIRFRWKLKKEYLQRFLQHAPSIYHASGTSFLANQGDNLVVGKYLGAEMLGLYGRAYNIMKMPTTTIGYAINKVAFPVMSGMKDDAQVIKGFLIGITFLLFTIGPVSVFSVIYAREVILIMLGENWLGVIVPLQVLAAGMYFRLAYKLNASILKSKGKFGRLAIATTFYAIFTIVGAYIGQLYFGLAGVAYSTLIAIFLHYILTFYFANREIHIGFIRFTKAHVYFIFVISIQYLLNHAVHGFISVYSMNVIALVLSGVVLNVLYLSLVLLITKKFSLNEYVNWWLSEGIRKFKKKRKMNTSKDV